MAKKEICGDYPDQTILEALIPWRQELDVFGNSVLGRSSVYLQQKECSSGECNLGNFYTDAMLYAFLGEQSYNGSNWSNITIALTTQGNFRVPLEPGSSIIEDLLEDSIAPFTINKRTSSRFLQVSGLRILYNITFPIGQRIQKLKVRCQHCTIPKYIDFEPEQDYQVVVMEYLANGKNGFGLIKDNARNLRKGPGDLAALINFMQVHDPIVAGIEGRITIVN